MRTTAELGGIYHIYNRGVDKRNVFIDSSDYVRFIHDLYEFNNIHYTNRWHAMSEVRLLTSRTRGERMVDLLAFCLMPNHYHLMIQETRESGITEFMRKIGTGYTNYFNKRYERSGALFQGKYKLVQVSEHSHFLYLPYYIHANPLDFIAPEWREDEMQNPTKAMAALKKYKWSSFQDYIGKKNFPSVIQQDFFLKFFDSPKQYEQDMQKWLKERGIENIEHLSLE